MLLSVGKENIYVWEQDDSMPSCFEAIRQGAEMVLCTAEVISYGAPVLPGAMFMLVYYKDIPIIGLPGCLMYAKRTIFDLVLPRIIADDRISQEELKKLGEGGLCLGCDICTSPNCGFGKGW